MIRRGGQFKIADVMEILDISKHDMGVSKRFAY